MLTQRKPFSKSQQRRLAIQMEALKREKEQKAKGLGTPAALTPPDPKLPPAIICDIDGTLAHKKGRIWWEWDRAIEDEIDLRTKFLLELIAEQNKWTNPVVPNITVFLLTGREERYAELTNQWLNLHGIPYDHLLMRRTGDRRPSYIVKEEIWSANIRDKYNVFFVLDDRKQDVEMYRSRGMYVMLPDDSRTEIQHIDEPLDKP